MFTVTFRVTKKQVAVAAAILVIAAAGGIWIRSAMSELDGDVTQGRVQSGESTQSQMQPSASSAPEQKPAEQAPKAKAQPQKTQKIQIGKVAAKTNEQRIAFLESFGWEVEDEEDEVVDVVIPKKLDEVYENYNEIQEAQGCDLSKYAGKRCKRYTYVVLNYPEKPENIRADILVYKGKIIGGDICSVELNGFMHGFAPAA